MQINCLQENNFLLVFLYLLSTEIEITIFSEIYDLQYKPDKTLRQDITVKNCTRQII
jgi:hypothetical protein